jgi:hypothetical protein
MSIFCRPAPTGKVGSTSLKISGVASQFAMQHSGIASPEVEQHSSFAIPKSVKSNGI